MANEEIITRIGTDLTGVDSGLKSWKQKSEEASEGVQKSFIKAGSASKAFKNVLNDATAQFPILGAAAKLAISPIVGLLGIAGTAMVFLKEKIDSANESFKKFTEDASKPIGDIQKVKEDAEKAADAAERSFAKWLASHSRAADEITTKLNKELGILEAQFKIYQQILDLKKESSKTGSGHNMEVDQAKLRGENALRERAQRELLAKRDVAGFDVAKAKSQQAAIISHEGKSASAISDVEKMLSESNEKLKKALDEKDKIQSGEIQGINVNFEGGQGGISLASTDNAQTIEREKRNQAFLKARLARLRAAAKEDARNKTTVDDVLANAQHTYDSYSAQATENQAAIDKNKLGILPLAPKQAARPMTYQERIAFEQAAYAQKQAASQEAWKMRNPDYARQVRESQMQQVAPQGQQALESKLDQLNHDLSTILGEKGIVVRSIANSK